MAAIGFTLGLPAWAGAGLSPGAADPAGAAVHYDLGQLALKRGDTDTALRELKGAEALEPDSARIHLALGDAYGRSAEKAGLFSKFTLARKCLAEYERAVSLEPDNAEIHERLFEYYSRAPFFLGGGSEKAAAEAAIIKRLDPGFAPASDAPKGPK
ncbi:MAG: tetratricopeptide repeat protein [Opitutaceae bacterium]